MGLLDGGCGGAADEIEDLARHGGGVAAGHHLLDDSGGGSAVLGAQESAGHGLVGAGLALLESDVVVDGLGLGQVALGGPALDEGVGNVGGHLDVALGHAGDDFLGVGDTVVGYHRFEEGLVQAWLQTHAAV